MITLGEVDAKTAERVFAAALRDGKEWESEDALLQAVRLKVYGKQRLGSAWEGMAQKQHLWLAAEHWREEDLAVTVKRRGAPGFSLCLRRTQDDFPLPAPGADSRRHTVDSVRRAEERVEQEVEAARLEEVNRRLLRFCPCTQGDACQRRLTRRNSVPLPDDDRDAHVWLRAIMRGPDSLRYDMLHAARRLQWTLRVDGAHFDPSLIEAAPDGSTTAKGPPTLMPGGTEAMPSTPCDTPGTLGGSVRTTSDAKRARGNVRRLAPSLPEEQLDSLVQLQLSFAALQEAHAKLQEQFATLRERHDGALSKAAQVELALAASEAEKESLRARDAARDSLLFQVEEQLRAARAERAAEAAHATAGRSTMAEQRWAQATNSVQLCLTWTGLLGPDRLVHLADIVKGVTENILLDLPQVRDAIRQLESERAAAGSNPSEGEDSVDAEDDVCLDEDDEYSDDDEDDEDDDAAAAADSGIEGGGAGVAPDAASDPPVDAERDPYLDAYPKEWALRYARLRTAGDRVLTWRTRLLLTLFFLRLVHNADVVAAFFGVSRSVCVRVYRRTLCELAAVNRVYGSWPSWSRLVELTSPAERSAYCIGPDAGVLYGNCTVAKCHRPPNLARARRLTSSYDGTCCFKYLVIVAPNGYACRI